MGFKRNKKMWAEPLRLERGTSIQKHYTRMYRMYRRPGAYIIYIIR